MLTVLVLASSATHHPENRRYIDLAFDMSVFLNSSSTAMLEEETNVVAIDSSPFRHRQQQLRHISSIALEEGFWRACTVLTADK